MKNTHYEYLYPIENEELTQAAEKLACIFFQTSPHSVNALTEVLCLQKKYLSALKEIHKRVRISADEHKQLVLFLYRRINITTTNLSRLRSGRKILKTHNILPLSISKWCFSANYESDTEEIIQEKIYWVQVLCETLEDLLHNHQIGTYLSKDTLRKITHLLRDHLDNLTTLLMSEDEILKESAIAEGFARKTEALGFSLVEVFKPSNINE